MRRAWGAVLLVALALGACAGDSDDEGSEATAGGASDATAEEVEESDDSGSGGVAAPTDAVARPAVQPLDPDAKVVRSATLEVEVAEDGFQTAVREATSMATALGGFVASSNTSSFEDGEGLADLVLRVPVARFDEALERLAGLGELESQSLEGKDVTGELVDLGARLKTLRAEEEALNTILSEARNVGDLLAVRNQITGIRQQIEQLAGQQAALEDRAAFSTISVTLHEPRAAQPKQPDDPDTWTLGDAWEKAVDAAEGVVGALIVVVGFATPLVLLGLPALLLWRRYGRRHAAQPG